MAGCVTFSKERIHTVFETLFAFFLMHILMRSIKSFTPLGEFEREVGCNFIPGTTMTMIGLLFLYSSGRSFQNCGFSLSLWPNDPEAIGRKTKYAIFALISSLWVFKVAFLARSDIQISHGISILMGRFFAVGFGEEIFFRGYIQFQINEAFGRPYRIYGASFGLGLIYSSFLFGFLHVLNSVDYFQSVWEFSWTWGFQTFIAGLIFGLIRESSGGVLLGAIIHAGRGLVSPINLN